MKTLGPFGKVVDFPSPSIRSVATIGAFRSAKDIIEPRLRRAILPPIVGQKALTGDSLLLLTDGGQVTFITTGSANISAQEDSVGFMFGTTLRAPSKGSTRGLFQDGKERTLIVKDQTRLGSRLFVLAKGINLFFDDEVIVDIHTAARQRGVITEILASPPDTALVRLDKTNQIVKMPFRHMVLTGPGLDVLQKNSFYNVRDVLAELGLE